MESMWCFQCGAEYANGVAVCIECGVGLVPEAPLPADEVGSAEEEQLAYEFHDWSFESRRMLDQLLTGGGIAHAWQGASMIVREADEAAVDALVEEVEHATLPTLDPELEHIAYEMAGWSAEQQTALSNRLGMAGIPHEFDAAGDLVVHAEDEAGVDAALDELERSADEDGSEQPAELDGVDVNELLSAIFGAADRLRRNARDPQGVLTMLDRAPEVDHLRVPFGFERPEWESIVASTRSVRELLEDDVSDDDDIKAQASRLRDMLFILI